jgi:hypothetical protein
MSSNVRFLTKEEFNIFFEDLIIGSNEYIDSFKEKK